MNPRKAIRVRKARHAGTCPRCGRLVKQGELIVSVRGAPFICISHLTRKDTEGRKTL